MSSSVESQPNRASGGRRTTVLASRPLLGYRTVDLVSAAMLGVAFGVVFWAWSLVYNAPAAALRGLPAADRPARRPVAARGGRGRASWSAAPAPLLAEVVAAAVSALIGSQWGWTVLLSGALQGLGVEIALALFAWRRFGPFVAVLAGSLAAACEVVFYEWWQYVVDFSWAWKLAYLGAFVVSGAVVAGLGGLLLVRALAKTGAANAMPPARRSSSDPRSDQPRPRLRAEDRGWPGRRTRAHLATFGPARPGARRARPPDRARREGAARGSERVGQVDPAAGHRRPAADRGRRSSPVR